MGEEEIISKIMKKKEFSELPIVDVKLALNKFNSKEYLDEERVKLTRKLLMKVFSVFASRKLLNLRAYDVGWILKKHISTRERIEYYKEIYGRILKDAGSKVKIYDLGAGVNGFSYKYFNDIGIDVNYVCVESIGQLVDSMNNYFYKEKLKGKAVHMSLFELQKVKKLVRKGKAKKIVFLFKTIDSLEMIEKDYGKKFLLELVPLVDKVVLSFATRSLISGKKFFATRKWLVEFIKRNFEVLDDFVFGNERYICFRNKL